MQVKAIVSHLQAAQMTEHPITRPLHAYVTNNAIKPLYIPNGLLTNFAFHFL